MTDGVPHPFTLRQLQYVVAVADTLSFGRAAARCHVSQPSLSAQVALVESALGFRVFERDRRRVLVPEAGREFVERARRILVAADDLAQAARASADPLTGTLRIGVIPTISPYLLPALTPGLRAAYPRLAARWTEDKTGVLVEQLHGGALDAALLALEADLGDVEHAVIGRDRFVLATPRGHALARGVRPVPHAALRDATVLLLDEGHCLREQALVFCGHARTRESEFRATSLPTLVQMVAAGAGVTLLPALALATERHRSDIEIRELAPPVPYRTLAVVWRRGSARGVAAAAVAATAQSAAATGV
jgi:LysR family hydrogen peroxide-inducible transcriptional activator